MIDSPVLPEELEALPALLEQARFPAPSGLLATHGDWDHLLGRSPSRGWRWAARRAPRSGCARRRARHSASCARSTRSISSSVPGRWRWARSRRCPSPGAAGSGSCELELHPAEGHTADGMAVWAPWARVLFAGDYLSSVEIPTLGCHGGAGPLEPLEAYLATLERLRPLVAKRRARGARPRARADAARALAVLEEDLAYLQALGERGAEAELPPGRRTAFQRRLHGEERRRSRVEAEAGREARIRDASARLER